MDERRIQYLVGVMVLATVIIAAILVVLFNDLPALWHGTYTIKIRAPEAPGVSPNTPVRKSGILIGRVTDVELDEEGNVLITARINAKYVLRQNDKCQITGGLLGDAELRFIRKVDQQQPPEASPQARRGGPWGNSPIQLASFDQQEPPSAALAEPIKPGSTIEATVAPDPTRVVIDMQQGLSTAIQEVSRTSYELRKVVSQVSDLLTANEQRIGHIIEQTDEMLAITQEAVTNANKLIGDPQLREDIKRAVAEAPRLLADARATMARTHETIEGMNRTMATLDRNLQNVESFTRPLGEHGEALVARIDGSVRDLELMMGELLNFSRSINNRDGTLGKLVHDRELYNNLNTAACNIRELSQRLEPILDDARVFTDKIARHPERLGVRGALERRPGIK